MKKLILIAAFAATSAHAEFWTGNKLFNMIHGDNLDQLVAIGYVTGAADASRGSSHCMPSQATVGQVHDMVKQHLDQNPSLRHMTADLHVVYVLSKAWPCPKKNSGSNL